MVGTVTSTVPPPSTAATRSMPASVANSFRVATVTERLALHLQPNFESNPTEFFNLCLSLARGIDYAVGNNEIPSQVQDLPLLCKQVCQRKDDLLLQAAIMVLMISIKNACQCGWFSEKDSLELCNLANEIGNCFCNRVDINSGHSDSLSIIPTVISRFYPQMKMGRILASLEVQPGYQAYVVDFHISKNMKHSPEEKIRLFVAQIDNTDTSACLISPQEVNFLLNGKGVDRRTNVLMDPGPQLPTDVTGVLKYGTNLLQAVGQFKAHYIVAVAFMSAMPLPGTAVAQDYVHSDIAALDPDSDLIEGPSRISLKCPISYTRIRTPVKGNSCKHLQCFDFDNYVRINSRRPSWRCPHCNQHVCYPDIRLDQNIVKVLKEVGENVSDVIVGADGSWRAILESDDNTDQASEKTLDCQKEGPEQQDSMLVMDLTADEDMMDAMDTSETEDRKPFVEANQPVAMSLNMPSQSVAPVVGGIPHPAPANVTTSSVISDAFVPPLNGDVGGHSNGNITSVMQNNGPFQQLANLVNNEYGRLQQRGLVNRNAIAVQALPVPTQITAPQQRQRVNVTASPITSQTTSLMVPRNLVNAISSSMDKQQQLARSHTNPHQNLGYRGPSASGQSQLPARGLWSQTPAAHRASSDLVSEPRNLTQQQGSLMPQFRSVASNVMRSSSPLARTQAQPGSAQVGVASVPGTTSSQNSRPAIVAQRAMQMARPPPSVPVQITSQSAARSVNVDRIRTPATEPTRNVEVAQAAGSGGLASEQDWRPTGRMRGSLSGRNYEAFKDLMIQPTQSAQAPRPPTSSMPPHLQAFLSNRSPHAAPSKNSLAPAANGGNSKKP